MSEESVLGRFRLRLLGQEDDASRGRRVLGATKWSHRHVDQVRESGQVQRRSGVTPSHQLAQPEDRYHHLHTCIQAPQRTIYIYKAFADFYPAFISIITVRGSDDSVVFSIVATFASRIL